MNEKKLIKKIKQLKAMAEDQGLDFSKEIRELEEKLIFTDDRGSNNDIQISSSHVESISPWEKVRIARIIERPKPQDFIASLITDFIEFKGDRFYGDDQAIIGGIGYFKDIPVTAIGTRRGKDIKQNMAYNFGMPHPEGYRKALRLAKQAERFRRPILFFVDTPGAFCGIEAEERGIAEAIATNLFELSAIKTPIITTITGEGGSGGALALAVADRLYMMEHAILSVISPEGCASIIFKDASRAEQAAESLGITPTLLKQLGIVDFIAQEGEGLHLEAQKGMKLLADQIYSELPQLMKETPERLVSKRYDKYRSMGAFDPQWIQTTKEPAQKKKLGFFKRLFRRN